MRDVQRALLAAAVVGSLVLLSGQATGWTDSTPSGVEAWSASGEPEVPGDRDRMAPELVFIARSDDPVDALAVGAVAGPLGADVLLTATDELSEATRGRLEKLAGRTVILVGGEDAVGPTVADAIEEMGFEVTRVDGRTRVETTIELGEFSDNLGHGRPLLTGLPVPGNPVVWGTVTADTFVATQTEAPTTPPTDRPIEQPSPRLSDDESLISESLFTWLEDGEPLSEQWLAGLLVFFLGLFGAGVATYLFLGESLPSSGGQVEVRQARQRITHLEDEYDRQMEERRRLLKAETLDVARLEQLTAYCAELDSRIDSEKQWVRHRQWQLYRSGLPLYLLLGGFTALLFASTLLQAIIAGFGWTAVVDRIGLERRKDEEEKEKDAALSKLESTAGELEDAVSQAAKLEAQNAELAKQAVDLATRSAQLEQTVSELNDILVEQTQPTSD